MAYCVIGGQYEHAYYGTYDTLLGAKRIASQHREYWDNWQGWNTPMVYPIEETDKIVTKGWITYYDGETIRVPKDHWKVRYSKDEYTGKWTKEEW